MLFLKKKSVESRKKSRSKKKRNIRFPRWLLILPLLLLIPFYYGTIYSKAVAAYQWFFKPFSSKDYPHYDSYTIRIPQGYQIHGIDVSWYQGKINWENVSRMEDDGIKIHFSFIKASEGVFIADRHFQRNWKESAKAGIIRGAYHYFKPSKSGYWQARFFLQTVNFKKGDLLPVVDVEERGAKSRQEFQANLKAYLDEIERELGVKPIIYSGYKFYEDYLSGDFDEYPLWVAHYYRPKLKKLSGDVNLRFWQHSDRGRVDGIQHRVDMNVFNGSVEELSQMLIK
ncbi:glycoside hydrolase family 25 protein [Daejeonella oryzae]|uniref:glycoside hydrolase family 25 protein n=1 Tax=Daejeonella oryzae TaxID=1122943 RepID=UPI00042A902E|nr:glycoside hydrolase family 25 protein [Daejeonella oryzae]